MKEKRKKRKNPTPWICCLWRPLDSAPMALGVEVPGPGRPSGAGQLSRCPCLALDNRQALQGRAPVACRRGSQPRLLPGLGLLWVPLPGGHFSAALPVPWGRGCGESLLVASMVGTGPCWGGEQLVERAVGSSSPSASALPGSWHPTQLPQQEGEPPQNKNKNKSASPGSRRSAAGPAGRPPPGSPGQPWSPPHPGPS